MQNISRQKYFYFIALILMATVYLPVVFRNLPPVVRSHHFWAVIWIISLLLFYPKIFLNKKILYLFIYALFIVISINTIWSSINEWNEIMLYSELYQISIGITIYAYFSQTKDFVSFAKIVKWSLVFLFITALMTIFSAAIDPLYARNLAGVSALDSQSEIDTVLSFKKYGGGEYGTAGTFMCLFPIIIYYFKNIEKSIFSRKQIFIFAIIILIALFSMQIFANILIAVFAILVSIINIRKTKQLFIIVISITLLFIFIPKNTYVNTIFTISQYFSEESELNNKINDLANYFESEESYETENTGIIGIIIFSILLYMHIAKNLKIVETDYKYYYLIATLTIIGYGFMKVVAGRDIWLAFFVILPGLNYLPLLKKDKTLLSN